jgi:hypothetical protein
MRVVKNRLEHNTALQLSLGNWYQERRCSGFGRAHLLLPYRAIFPMLCTIQYSFHCLSTHVLSRPVNRFVPSVWITIANVGATVPGRGYALSAVVVPPTVGIKAFYHPLRSADSAMANSPVGFGYVSDFGGGA